VAKDPQREKDLALIIESIYKLFSEINNHLKRLLDPNNKSKAWATSDSTVKEESPKVQPATSTTEIKQNLTNYAQ